MDSLQSINLENEIINHTSLGQSIYSFSENNISLILDYNGCGWLDGGCYALAHAFHYYLSSIGVLSEIKCCGRAGFQDHAVVTFNHSKYGKVFIDGDGLSAEDEIISKMILLEGCFNSVIEDYWRVFEDEVLISPILMAIENDEKLVELFNSI